MSRKVVGDQENREWTREDFNAARPAHEVLSEDVLKAFPRTRGKQVAPTKVPVSLRLSSDVVERFKASGPGWQRRMDEALRKAAGL